MNGAAIAVAPFLSFTAHSKTARCPRSVRHEKPSRHLADALKAQLFVEVQGATVLLDHGVELHQPKAQRRRRFQTVPDQRLARAPVPRAALHGVTGVGDVAAAPFVVGVEDVKADEFAIFLRHGGKTLRGKEDPRRLRRQKVELGEGHAVLNYLIPNEHHARKVGLHIGAHVHPSSSSSSV